MTKSNLKTMPEEKPEQMSYDEIRRLADDLADDLMNLSDGTLAGFMLLMQEIADHPFDHSHVETVANVTLTYLFAHSHEAARAYKQFIRDERAKLRKGGASR
jgi:hypothetical protein